ncbi:OmpA family protein [Marinifilum fragile]|uniref:OmpA family protein n=1 Tax=Marinifilum fragile TaxID=570161 RepID=UPI002AA7DE5B|nr:OmpA family protein [Marinifilum fragile]
MKRFALLLFACLLSSFAFSQKLSVYLGDKQFEQFNYVKAIEYYEHSLEKDSTNVDVIRKLGQSYYKMSKYESSVKYFEILVKHPDREAADLLIYGEVAKEIGDYFRSEELLKEYQAIHPNDKYAISLLADLERTKANAMPFLLCKIDSVTFNSKYSDFAPVFYKNQLVFSSARKSRRFRNDIYGWDGQYFLELFQFNKEKPANKQVVRFAKRVGTKYHEAVVCFSADYKTMFFTRSNYNNRKLGRDKDGINNLKIFIANEVDGKWKIAEAFPYNSNDYSVGHPSLSADGKTLYFASDMPGGFGGTDIYTSELENGKWSTPKNLGAKINTKENEMFPHINKEALFFASNGHSGMGGLDLYMVKNLSGNKKPIHLGKPLNSEQDDFSLILSDNGTKGYFASNRNGGVGEDDIYSFEIAKENEVEFELRHMETKELLKADQVLSNGSLDTEFDFDASKQSYKKKITREQKYAMHFEKEGFHALDTSFYSSLWEATQKHVFYMNPIPEVKDEIVEVVPEVIPPIYFDFDKSNITTEAYEIVTRVYKALEKNADFKLIISANTDIRGSNLYNEHLAKRRAESTFAELVKMGIAKERMEILVNGERKPLVQNQNQTLKNWHRNNRRVDFELKK